MMISFIKQLPQETKYSPPQNPFTELSLDPYRCQPSLFLLLHFHSCLLISCSSTHFCAHPLTYPHDFSPGCQTPQCLVFAHHLFHLCQPDSFSGFSYNPFSCFPAIAVWFAHFTSYMVAWYLSWNQHIILSPAHDLLHSPSVHFQSSLS